MRVTIDLPKALVDRAADMAGVEPTAERMAELLEVAMVELFPEQWRSLGHLVEVVYHSEDLYATPRLVRHTFQPYQDDDDETDRPTLVWDGERVRVTGGDYYVTRSLGIVDS